MITRTVTRTNYDVMVVNAETKQVENLIVSIPSADTLTEKQLVKQIAESIPDGKLYVQAVKGETEEILYGMTEADFINLAKVLPSRTKAE